MRRMLLVAAVLAAIGVIPAAADAGLCGDLVVIVNGETHVDEHHCLPPDGEPPAPPALPDPPGLPDLPSAPELPALPEPPALPDPGGLPGLPGLPV